MQKNDYSRIFEINVKGRVSAKAVKEELIKQIITPKKKIIQKCIRFLNYL